MTGHFFVVVLKTIAPRTITRSVMATLLACTLTLCCISCTPMGHFVLKKLIVRHIRLPLKKPIKHASHERHETENLIIECHLNNGIVGYGEGVPRDYVTGETVGSGLEVLRKNHLDTLREAPATFSEAVAHIDQLQLRHPSNNDPRDIATNAVRCAL